MVHACQSNAHYTFDGANNVTSAMELLPPPHTIATKSPYLQLGLCIPLCDIGNNYLALTNVDS